jgi:NADH-quinone oxidoreductase subunit L
MFLACGVGAFTAGIFHLMTHAFFKALLFLGAGSISHAVAGELDMRKMGDMRKHIPRTYWTFMIATLALCGIFPFAGFFSKDEILFHSLVDGHIMYLGHRHRGGLHHRVLHVPGGVHGVLRRIPG